VEIEKAAENDEDYEKSGSLSKKSIPMPANGGRVTRSTARKPSN
jgi:hypothetical protein